VARKKLGVMGGTFNPIHNGHIETAEFVKQYLKLEKVLLIPARESPFKQGEKFAPPRERFKMVELAIEGKTDFLASDMELRRRGVSYTYNTIKALQEVYGTDNDLFFLIGADSLQKLQGWHRIKDILSMCTFVAATRPGFGPQVDQVIESFGELGASKIIWVRTPEFAISSTDIRERIKQGISIHGLVAPQVEEYIKQRDLYRR